MDPIQDLFRPSDDPQYGPQYGPHRGLRYPIRREREGRGQEKGRKGCYTTIHGTYAYHQQVVVTQQQLVTPYITPCIIGIIPHIIPLLPTTYPLSTILFFCSSSCLLSIYLSARAAQRPRAPWPTHNHTSPCKEDAVRLLCALPLLPGTTCWCTGSTYLLTVSYLLLVDTLTQLLCYQ